jgi:hypothetical protein
MERTTKGRVTLTFVDAETQEVVKGGKHFTWKGETFAQAQAINVKLGEGIAAAAKGDLFGADFNPGADGKTYEAHVRIVSQYEDSGEVESVLDWTKNDLDSVEVALLASAAETLK